MFNQEKGRPEAQNIGAAQANGHSHTSKNGNSRVENQGMRSQGREKAASEKSGQGQRPEFRDPESWPEAVDGSALLDEMSRAIRRFVVLSPEEADAAALWALHTHSFDAQNITPRLAITSPDKGCGKTTLLDVLSLLVRRPIKTDNITTAAFFRLVAEESPTVLMDEADTFLNGRDDLRGVLNSGHRKGGVIIRTVGEDYEPRQFSTFCPVAIAKIGHLAPTLADRSISISLKRRRRDQPVERLRMDRVDEALGSLRAKALRWTADNCVALSAADPAIPDSLQNRAADNWRSLLAIADLAGGDWPNRARVAAVRRSVDREDVASTGEMLLSDIRALFMDEIPDDDRITTQTLLKLLFEVPGRPWTEWSNGLGLTEQSLAGLLRPYGISPGTIRIGEKTAKGYYRAAFEEAWTRYLPPLAKADRGGDGVTPQEQNAA